MANRHVFFVTLLIILALVSLFVVIASANAQDASPTPTPWIVVITATPEAPGKPAFPSQSMPELSKVLAASGPGDVLGLLSDRINELWPNAVEQQDKYKAMAGHYFQGYFTHSSIPANGENLYPDMWLTHPSDQQFRWVDIGVIQFEPMPYTVRMDNYSGPEGPGWVACFRVNLEKTTWEKCINHGPEATRDHDWSQIILGDGLQ